tara:strand:+ start:8592 stop:8774 length:183 start_codon:yes stop_codon:yes gene_type:complete
MQAIYAIFITILFIGIGFFLLKNNKGIPSWVQILTQIEPNIWNFGVIIIATISIIKYFLY